MNSKVNNKLRLNNDLDYNFRCDKLISPHKHATHISFQTISHNGLNFNHSAFYR